MCHAERWPSPACQGGDVVDKKPTRGKHIDWNASESLQILDNKPDWRRLKLEPTIISLLNSIEFNFGMSKHDTATDRQSAPEAPMTFDVHGGGMGGYGFAESTVLKITN